ncbi:MAG TPA: hypothetical protein DGX96_00965 [Lachnospiraceae bacterium]|nr:hypothetical protein [Lachnospiraceae bacterium]
MYAVSEQYKAAMKQPVQRFRMTGTIGDHPFTDDNILAGSFSITNQCTGNDEITIGQVYVGELDVTFMNMPISRYGWKGLEIRPVFGMKIADGTYEDVPLGVFTVETAEWTASGVVIKAYDHMALLDKNCNKVITEVTPYQCAQAIAEATGVNFANTEKEFESFANGTTMISETTTNDVETWRDLVSWLAQTIGCFATADREGNIVFRSFNQTVVDTIDDAHRFTGGSFSDYVTRYTGLSVVNMEDSTTSYYAEDEDDGLTMNLGSNPFLQYGVAATKEEMAKAILTAIQQIRYVPFTCRAIGNPAYDLGDVLVFQNGLADGDALYCITKFTFKYNQYFEMVGVGKDPSLASARSKTDKNLVGLASNTDENQLVHYRFTNTQVVEVGDGKRVPVASIRFATATKASEVSLWAELLLDTKLSTTHAIGSTTLKDVTIADYSAPTPAELQSEITELQTGVSALDERMTSAETELASPSRMTVTVSYTLAGDEIDYHPVETYDVSGKHILSLHYYIGDVKANTVYLFVIFLTAAGGALYLDTNCINAVIEGMGLAGTGKWDGTINAEEEFIGFSMGSVIGQLTDEAKTALLTPVPTGASDAISFDMASVLGSFTDSTNIGIVVRYFILSDTEGKPDYSSTYITTNSDDAFALQTQFNVESNPGTVDTGQLDVLEIYSAYPEIETLEEVSL